MNQFNYINLYTGELYHNLIHALTTIVSDMKHHKECRTLQMFQIKRLQ